MIDNSGQISNDERLNSLIGIGAAAALKGHNNVWLQYWIRTGRGPRYQEIAGRKVFRISDVMAWEPKKRKTGPKKELHNARG